MEGQDVLTSGLPEDHPIEWLAEAQELFKSDKPTFVLKRRWTVGSRKTVLLLTNSTGDHKGEVVWRSWDSLHFFWTLDVDEKRLIVKAFAEGGRGVSKYYAWLGSSNKFSTHAFAMSGRGETTRAPVGISALSQAGYSIELRQWSKMKTFPLSEPSLRSEDQYIPELEVDPSTLLRLRQNRDDTEAGAVHRSIEGQFDGEGDSKRKSHDPSSSANESNLSRLSVGPKSSRVHKSQDLASTTSSTSINDTWSDSLGPEHLVKEGTWRTSQSEARTTPGRVNREIKGARTSLGLATRQSPAQELAAPESFAQSSKRKRGYIDLEDEGLSDALDDEDNPSATPLRSPGSLAILPIDTVSKHKPSGAQSHHTQTEETISTLSLHKQNNTILRVALASSNDFVPLKLRSCATLASFFITVLGVYKPADGSNSVPDIRITFEWKQAGDVEKTMLLKKGLADTFEIFLETVDEAPCWENHGGKCRITVEVVPN